MFIPQKSLSKNDIKNIISIIRKECQRQKILFFALMLALFLGVLFIKYIDGYNKTLLFLYLFSFALPIILYVLAENSSNEEIKTEKDEKEKNSSNLLQVFQIKVFILCVLTLSIWFFLLFGSFFIGINHNILTNCMAENFGLMVLGPILAISYGLYTNLLPRGVGLISNLFCLEMLVYQKSLYPLNVKAMKTLR